MFKHSIYFVLILFCCHVNAQQGEYFITNYLPKVYNGHANNFAVTQDNEGKIFVANSNGLLSFDGTNWKITQTENEVTIISLFKSKAGVVYYGLEENGEFGIIAKDNKGRFEFNSLVNNLSSNDKPKEIIRQIAELDNAIYFLSSDRLVEYKSNRFKVYKPHNSFHTRFSIIGKHLFVTDIDNGVFVLVNGVLKPVLNSESLSNNKAFFTYQVNRTQCVVGYRNEGIYNVLYDSVIPEKTQFVKLNALCDHELIESEINNGLLLKDGNFIFTSNKKGAFLINSKFEIIKRFNDKVGLYENNIKAAYQDNNGNLWFPTYYGISYVELNSNLHKYNRENGVSGLVQSACYYKDKLYIGTDKGLQVFNSDRYSFENVENFNHQTWYVQQFNDVLLIATRNGLFSYDGVIFTQINDVTSNFIYKDPENKNKLYMATESGVDIYEAIHGDFKLLKSYNLNSEVRSIASDHYKNIYFSTVDKDIYFLNSKKKFQLDSITGKSGLPTTNYENYVFNYEGNLLVGTQKGMYTIENEKGNEFLCRKHSVFYFLTKESEVFRAAELKGDLLCSQNIKLDNYDKYEQKFIYLEKQNGKYVINNSGISRLKQVKPNAIRFDSVRNVALISSDEGLFILSKQQTVQKRYYDMYINVECRYENKIDTIIQNAHYTTDFNKNIPDIIYKQNNINFKIGYNCFENPDIVELSYYLEGKDKGFGPFEKKFDFEYNNLYEGNYVFHVKARNEQTKEMLELHYPFVILPPWYRTIWAYIVYAILFVGFIYVVIKFYTKRLKDQNIKLEGIVQQRTLTIAEQVHLLEHQKKEITDSINYAQNIQQAILPSLNTITSTYENQFIYFQPKDIVSGDFYWFKRINDHEFLIACADCTGHGVPGAFMSMICSEKLSEAVLHTTSPAEILFRANNTIKEVLNQNHKDESKSKDGMEIALVKYNSQTRKLLYAGANRPLWLIKNNSKEVFEIKPTKASIASFTDSDFVYQQYELILENNDTVYLTSDGYPDQFGGPDGKKFMAKNMKQLLIEICDLKMPEQKNILSKRMKEWMGDLEQVDDLLVIGLKVN